MAVTPDVDYVTLAGVIGAMVGDTDADPDKNPDWVTATEGTVTFTPVVDAVQATDSTSGKTVEMVPFPIVCTIDAQGRITYGGDTTVALLDLGSSKVTPTVPRGKTAYNVSFSGLKMDGASVQKKAFGINPSQADAGGDGTVTLWDLEQLPTSSGGAAIARGQGVPSITAATAGDVVTYNGTDIAWAASPAAAAVRFDESQTLTGDQQTQAQANLGLPAQLANYASVDDVPAVQDTAPADTGKLWVDTSGTAFAPSAVLLVQAPALAIPDSAWTTLTWPNTASYDDDSFFDPAVDNTLITLPVTGRYRIHAHAQFASSTTGYRVLSIMRKDNGTEYGRATAAPANIATSACDLDAFVQPVSWAAGRQFYVRLWQNSGGPLNTVASGHTWFFVERIG